MAARWLDAARYADTNGYQTDGERTMWRWRDWVIEAFNRNLPFDQFTIEQIAGDLLPGATLDQRIATGFNRNHRGNAEGGIIPEEYAVEYVVDRVDTTATVWLGLTMGCARCHDHKFDPITQREFYQFFAFFNNVPERGRAIKCGNSPPMIPSPTPTRQQLLDALDRLAAAEDEQARAKSSPLEAHGRVGRWPAGRALGPWRGTCPFPVGSTCRSRRPSCRRKLEGPIHFTPGRRQRPCSTEPWSQRRRRGQLRLLRQVLARRLDRSPEHDAGTVLVADVGRRPMPTAIACCSQDGKVQVNLVKRWLDDSFRVETDGPLPAAGWHHVMATYDGSRLAAGVKIYVDGQPQTIKVLLDELNQSFKTAEPLRIGGGGDPMRASRGPSTMSPVSTELALGRGRATLLATPDTIGDIVATRAPDRSRSGPASCGPTFSKGSARGMRQAAARVATLRKEKRAIRSRASRPRWSWQEMPTPAPYVRARSRRNTTSRARTSRRRAGQPAAAAARAEQPARIRQLAGRSGATR